MIWFFAPRSGAAGGYSAKHGPRSVVAQKSVWSQNRLAGEDHDG
jgi:hypothetical protein